MAPVTQNDGGQGCWGRIQAVGSSTTQALTFGQLEQSTVGQADGGYGSIRAVTWHMNPVDGEFKMVGGNSSTVTNTDMLSMSVHKGFYERGPAFLDGGLHVEGALWLDGGTFQNGTIIVDGGVKLAVQNFLGLDTNSAVTLRNSGGGVFEMKTGSGSGVFQIDSAGNVTANNEVLTSAGFRSTVAAGNYGFKCQNTDCRFQMGNGALYMSTVTGNELTLTGPVLIPSTTNKGVKVLTAGVGTVTVTSGAVCNCSLNTGTVTPACSVTATTLTIVGLGTDSINYQCF